jgi:hypothetical protein
MNILIAIYVCSVVIVLLIGLISNGLYPEDRFKWSDVLMAFIPAWNTLLAIAAIVWFCVLTYHLCRAASDD